jgi:hypothetical protein
MKNKEHLTTEGIKKIVSIRASMDKGLSDGLKAAFLIAAPDGYPALINTLFFALQKRADFIQPSAFFNMSGAC